MSLIHKDRGNCTCVGCQAARIDGMDHKNIMNIVGVILKHGGRIVDPGDNRRDVKIIKIESHMEPERDRSALYTAMMDDAGIPLEDRA